MTDFKPEFVTKEQFWALIKQLDVWQTNIESHSNLKSLILTEGALVESAEATLRNFYSKVSMNHETFVNEFNSFLDDEARLRKADLSDTILKNLCVRYLSMIQQILDSHVLAMTSFTMLNEFCKKVEEMSLRGSHETLKVGKLGE